MEFFLKTESDIFDNLISSRSIEFMDAIATFTEQMTGTIFEEKKNDRPESFIVKINKFFADLINGFQTFKAQIQLELDKRIRATEIDTKLRKMHTQMKAQKNIGINKVEVVDCWTLRDKYLECVNSLRKYAKKFSEMKYKRTSDIDDDLAQFNKLVDKYSDEIDELKDKKITVDIQKMIDFVEDEISGRSRVLVSLDDAVTILKQMKQDALVLETRKDILGPDIIPKHMGFIRQIATKISAFIKKWAVKIITTIVFIVG